MKDSNVKDDIRELVKAEMDRSGMTQKQIAEEVGTSTTRLSQWLSGKYGGDVEGMNEEMRSWLRSKSKEATNANQLPQPPSWIPTPTAKRVLASLAYAQMAADIAIVYGGAGVGKSCTAKHYRSNNPNVWIATMTPSTANVATCIDRIAQSVGIQDFIWGAAKKEAAVIGRIADTGGLLVIDEAQHLSTPALEVVRSLHDAAEIGLVLMGNEQVYSQMTGGGSRQAHFAQLFSRIGSRTRLNKPNQDDIHQLMEAWAVPADARAYCLKIGQQPGALRYLTKTLRFASMMAHGDRQPLNTDHIKAALMSLGNL